MVKQIYDTRNRANLAKLGDNTKVLANKLYNYCIEQGIQILIYETIRTVAQQKENVRKGASQTMQSYHIVGQALDFVLVDSKGNALWNAYKTANADKVINYAKKLGFESGRDWGWDAPHLQYKYKGYGTDTFGKKATVSTSVSTASVSKVSNSSNNETLVGYLEARKIDSSFSNRKKLATAHGIKSYTGTAGQNMTLLAKLKATEKPTGKKEEKVGYYNENPKVVVTTKDEIGLYKSVDFTEKEKIKTYPKGTKLTILGVEKTKNGTPRLKTAKGYVTANKDYVTKK